MKPLQLRNLLETAGLSQSEAARRLEISDRMMRRYVAGDAAIPRVIWYALLYIIEEQKREAERDR